MMTRIFLRIQDHVIFAWIMTYLLLFGACGDFLHKERPDLAFTGSYDFKHVRTVPPFGNIFYSIGVEVKNQGTVPIKRVRVVADSKGPEIEGNLSPLDKNGYISIAAGETVKVQFQFIFQKQLGGEYEFTITADPSNTVQEKDESNNRLVFSRML